MSTKLYFVLVCHLSIHNLRIIEIMTRRQGDFNAEYVLGALMSFDSEESVETKQEFVRRNLANYPYVIVMDAGDRNLKEVIDQEQFVYASQNHHTQSQIKLFTESIMLALQHVHEKGYAHGDLKVTRHIKTCFIRSVILCLLHHNYCIFCDMFC